MIVQGQHYRTVWLDGAVVYMIDQRLLPHRFEIVSCGDSRETVEAIANMTVRGAGAIGAAAGYAMAQAALQAPEASFASSIEAAACAIRGARPTAHDLFYSVDRVLNAIREAATPGPARDAAVKIARQLADENANAGEAIGRAGASLFRSGSRILTHCNAGWLAFVDWGSALAPIYQAHRQGVTLFVYVDETRPRSQGAKLTAWELAQEGVPHAVIADTAAGSFFQRGEVDAVIVGADRIAANGDVANKIGTYTIALLATHHGVPFYVAAPRSTFDVSTPNGAAIPIEQRAPEEVCEVSGMTRAGTLEQVRITPEGSSAKNPAFDVTPAAFVTAFVTEGGLIPPDPHAIAQFVRAVGPTPACVPTANSPR